MFDKVSALEILKSNGFNSNLRSPYLYIDNKNIGVALEIDDPIYGKLNRLFIFKNAKDMDIFLKKYRWYLATGSKNNAVLKLSDYGNINPKINYILNDLNLNLNDMQRISHETLRNLRDEKNILLDECENLNNFYLRILNDHQETIDKYNKIVEEKNFFLEQLQLKINLYNKKKTTKVEVQSRKASISNKELYNIGEIINKYRLDNSTSDNVKDLLLKIWFVIKELEVNSSNIDVIKEIVASKLDIKILKEKIKYIESILNSRRRVSVNLAKEFANIESEIRTKDKNKEKADKEIKKMVDIASVKYSAFDNLNIYNLYTFLMAASEAKETEIEPLVKKYSKEPNKIYKKEYVGSNEVINNLLLQYSKLSLKEKNALAIGTGYLSKLISNPSADMIIKCYTKLASALKYNTDPTIKMIFKDFKIDSSSEFIKSVSDIVSSLDGISKKMYLNTDALIIYETNNINEYQSGLLKAKIYNAEKDIVAKSDNILVNANLNSNTGVFYTPYKVDYNENGILAIKNNNSKDLVIPCELVSFKYDINTTKEVTKYDFNLIKENGHTISNGYIKKSMARYASCDIYKKYIEAENNKKVA